MKTITRSPKGNKTAPFLSIFTRCYKRPKMLAENKRSVDMQTSKDWEQIFLIDEVGVGVHEANKAFAQYAHLAKGKYVFLLDDDDKITDPEFIAGLLAISTEDPDVIYFRNIIHSGRHDNLYPTEEVWGKVPKIDHIGGSCFAIKRELYRAHAHHFQRPSTGTGGDFEFIKKVHGAADYVYWWDRIVFETQRVSKGKPE